MTIEELRKEILLDRSSSHWEYLIEEIRSTPNLINTLIKFTFDENSTLAFRSSWILDNATEKHPSLINSPSKVNLVVKGVINSKNYSVIRSITRLLSRQKIPNNTLGVLVNQCFIWLNSIQTPVAIKVHCMQVLLNASIKLPDLKNELQITIENQLPYGSAGFKSRGYRILKELETIN